MVYSVNPESSQKYPTNERPNRAATNKNSTTALKLLQKKSKEEIVSQEGTPPLPSLHSRQTQWVDSQVAVPRKEQLSLKDSGSEGLYAIQSLKLRISTIVMNMKETSLDLDKIFTDHERKLSSSLSGIKKARIEAKKTIEEIKPKEVKPEEVKRVVTAKKLEEKLSEILTILGFKNWEKAKEELEQRLKELPVEKKPAKAFESDKKEGNHPLLKLKGASKNEVKTPLTKLQITTQLHKNIESIIKSTEEYIRDLSRILGGIKTLEEMTDDKSLISKRIDTFHKKEKELSDKRTLFNNKLKIILDNSKEMKKQIKKLLKITIKIKKLSETTNKSNKKDIKRKKDLLIKRDDLIEKIVNNFYNNMTKTPETTTAGVIIEQMKTLNTRDIVNDLKEKLRAQNAICLAKMNHISEEHQKLVSGKIDRNEVNKSLEKLKEKPPSTTILGDFVIKTEENINEESKEFVDSLIREFIKMAVISEFIENS